jgi:hypothetical protein
MGAHDDALVERIEALRIPPQPEAAQLDWKDWYHFVLLHAASGWRVIANVNLAGGGELQYTLVVHVPGEPARVHGCSRSAPWTKGTVRAAPLAIVSDEVELRFEQQAFHLRIQPKGLDLGLVLQARPDATPLLVTEGSPFGSGFIGWGLVPGLLARGEVWACGTQAAIDPGWFCYQDHNFGRFRWGEDFGWQWLVAHAQAEDGPAITVVLDRRTDRNHRSSGLPYLFVLLGRRLHKVFLGPALQARWRWSHEALLPPRLPGVMATRLGDRTTRTPTALVVDAADERDRIAIRLEVDAYLEVIGADNQSAGFTRIGESSGHVAVTLASSSASLQARGLAYAEYTR